MLIGVNLKISAVQAIIKDRDHKPHIDDFMANFDGWHGMVLVLTNQPRHRHHRHHQGGRDASGLWCKP